MCLDKVQPQISLRELTMLSVASGAFSSPAGRPMGRIFQSVYSRAFVSPLGPRKMGREVEIERERLNKCKVVFCLGVDASHSTRNDIWITLTIRLWFPILLERRVKLWEYDYHTITASLQPRHWSDLPKSQTLRVLLPLSLIYSSGLSHVSSLSGCSHFF